MVHFPMEIQAPLRFLLQRKARRNLTPAQLYALTSVTIAMHQVGSLLGTSQNILGSQ